MRLKLGDSFWFERPVGPQAFTKGAIPILTLFIFETIILWNSILAAQLQQIYETSLAALICRNSDAVNRSPGEVMRKVSRDNPVVDCSQLDTFSFAPWRELEIGPLAHVSLGEPEMRVRTMGEE